MQEINLARQKSSAESSKRKEQRCRVCDGPVDWPNLVCRECWLREREQQEWESYLEFLDSDDTAPDNLGLPGQRCRKRDIASERPMLIVLCGPSHSGKSTFARKLRDGFAIVSSDNIRRKITRWQRPR